MKHHFILKSVFILLLLTAPALAQSPAGEVKSFAKDGLSFSYPADWTLADKSNEQAQHLILTQAKSSVIMMVIAYREPLAGEDQLQVALRGITEPYIESIMNNFAASGRAVERDNPCTEAGGVKVPGVRVRGLHRNEPSTGEVYALVRGRRFVNLVYIRADKDAPRGDIAWETFRKTIKIDNQGAAAPGSFSDKIVSGGVLNGKALNLPKPEYSSFAKNARATGTVVVQVTIDEQGNVASAKAISGHQLLHRPSEEAALRAKFAPVKLCDQPIKVTGTIAYNFAY